jgi:uncharacterized protein YegP (UPF0339 family)
MGAAVVRAVEQPAAAQKQKQAQTPEEQRNREQAIESVKKSLAEDPKDAGLQHALQCLQSSEQCKDEAKLKHDIDSVKRHLDKDPQNEGLRHAMAYLETHHQQLEMQRMEHERAMQRQGSGRPETRPETPAHPDGAEGKGR